jgi:GntR family transcriptional regulator
MARNLAIADGEECLRIEVLVNFDGVPYSLTTNYLPGRFTDRAQVAPYGGDWWKYLEHLGALPDVADVSIEATAADAYVAPLLDVEVGDPILMVTRLVHDTDGRPLNFAFSRSRSDRLVLNMRIPVGGPKESTEDGKQW